MLNVFTRKAKKQSPGAPKNSPASTVKRHSHDVSSNPASLNSTQPALFPVFGVPLATAVENSRAFDGVSPYLPLLIRLCVDYVEQCGLEVEGIYRMSASKQRLDELEAFVDEENGLELRSFSDPHEAAGLLKRFLIKLPEHVLTARLRQQFQEAISKCTCPLLSGGCRCAALANVRTLLDQLPNENAHLLACVFRHASNVIGEERHNKMGIQALGLLLQATLNLSKPEVLLFTLNSDELFQHIPRHPAYRPPLSLNELRAHPPESLAELEREIAAQQTRLEDLHNRVIRGREAGVRTERREKEMWDVQTGITVLKRKLKTLQAAMDPATTLSPHIHHSDEHACEPCEQAPTISTSSMVDMVEGLNPALLEKQLLAAQHSLKEEIADEKRKIGQLLSQLRELNGGGVSPNVPRKDSPTPSTATQTEPSTQHSRMLIDAPPTNGYTHRQSLNSWEAIYAAEEKRREELLGEVIRLRNLCARLRARLEQESVSLKTAIELGEGQAKVGSIAEEEEKGEDGKRPQQQQQLLITRF